MQSPRPRLSRQQRSEASRVSDVTSTNSTCTNLLIPSRHSRGPDPVRRKVLSVVRRSFPPSSMEQAWFAGQEPDQAGDSTSMPASAAAERSRLS